MPLTRWGTKYLCFTTMTAAAGREASPSLPAEWSRAYLRSVWGSSASDVYTVGAGYDVSGQYFPLLYHNDGTGWTSRAFPA